MLRIAAVCATWPVAQVVAAGGVDQVGGLAALLVNGGPWSLAALLLFALWRKDRDAARRTAALEREKSELTERLFALAERNAAVATRIDETLRTLAQARRCDPEDDR